MYRLPLLLVIVFACSSGTITTPVPTTPVADLTKLQVAGSYSTAVTMLVDSCGGSVVSSMPTVVTHTADATTISLLHAGSRYDGTISRDGKFQTVAGTPLVLDNFSYIVTVSGTFSAGGFDAIALVDRTTAGAAGTRCRYVAKWVGARSSGTNVIPGT